MSLQLGQVLDGKYRIVRLIGEGGMGSVFEGENTFISRRVAIKVLHAGVAGNESVLKRFEREAQAAGRIGSDHILEVLDLGTLPGGDRYMVMEYLEGEELSARIERLGTIAPRPLAILVRQTLVGLRAAHAAEIVHRDLKPDNIFVVREKAGHTDFVKIIDFGISKFNALIGDMSMTTTGAVMGTPFYMSPEQAKGSAGVDARTDLYAMGVIMYEALTGRVPFEGTSFNDLMFKIVLSDPPPLPPEVPADFGALVCRAMAREAHQRFQSADEFLAAIDTWLADNGASGRESSASLELSQVAFASRGGVDLSRTALAPSGTLTSAAGAKTSGNWAKTSGDATPASRPRKLLVVGLGGAMLAAAAGAFAVLGGSGASAPLADVPSAAAVAPAAPEPAAPEPVVVRETPPVPVAAATAPVHDPVSAASTQKAPPLAKSPVAQAARPVAARTATKPATVRASARPTLKPATAAAAKRASSSNRDFGY